MKNKLTDLNNHLFAQLDILHKEIEMSRRSPIGASLEQMQKAYREEMMDRAGAAMTMRPLVDKEVHYIEEVISALKKIEDTDCTEEVWETIQAAIEDLEQCV